MHKLDRSLAIEPVCLAKYHYRTHTWDDVKEDKQKIRESLEQMQDVRCAYCEGPVYADGHIEHFRRKNKNHFPSLTFVWSNLFLACGSQDHCGHYKDRPGALRYDSNNLVKPDEHEPDQYFYFHSSGDVLPRSGINAQDLARATETIRVFNLKCAILGANRRRALRIYQQKQPGILEVLMEFDEKTRQDFIDQEIQATRLEPHGTVIRHYFERAF